MIKVGPGDIFATKGKGALSFLSRKFTAPETDYFHFGLIWIRDGDDWITIESTGRKGIHVSRLSFHKNKDIKFYRVNCSSKLRKRAPIEVTKYGRSHYDYFLIFKIITQSFWLFIKQLFTEGRFRRIRAEEFTWAQDDKFVCTEVPVLGFSCVGVNFIPIKVCPLPCAYKQAELDGKITEI